MSVDIRKLVVLRKSVNMDIFSVEVLAHIHREFLQL